MTVTSVGYRCLDRDACFRLDDVALIASHAHDASDCTCDEGDAIKIQYRNRRGDLVRISIEHAEELMQCTYATRLIFQRSQILRNYAFWGFTPASTGGFSHLPIATTRVSPSVAIGHVKSLETIERTALGLFATTTIAYGEWIGEYTGVVQVDTHGECDHDAYGMCYPSVFEGGQLYLTAAEYGNEIRCINHSATPNVRFTPTIHDDGILHVDCFALCSIAPDEQLVVDYGPSYWHRAGVEPFPMG